MLDFNLREGSFEALPVLSTQRRFVFVGHFLDKLDYADNLWTRINVRCEGFGRRNHCPGRRIWKEELLSGAKDLEGGIIWMDSHSPKSDLMPGSETAVAVMAEKMHG